MATETPNLHLEKPAENEFYDVKKFNANWDKIDAAVKSLSSAEEYSAAQTYALGDYCTHDGKLYRCTTAITEAESWTEAHWAATTLAAELMALFAAVAGKAALTHAAQHASGGTDPITPASIGADPSGSAAAVQANLNVHTGRTDNPHGVTAAQVGAATTTTLSCTVPVSWTASGSYYYQQVSVSGMLASDNPVADILTGSDNDANKLYAEAWGKVQSIDTLAGAVGIWCTEAPTVAFPVQFKVVR